MQKGLFLLIMGDAADKHIIAAGQALRVLGNDLRVSVHNFGDPIMEFQPLMQFEKFRMADCRNFGKSSANNSWLKLWDDFNECLKTKNFAMMILLRIADPIDSGVIQDHEVVQQIKAYAETDFLIIDDGLHSSLMESADLITDVKALK